MEKTSLSKTFANKTDHPKSYYDGIPGYLKKTYWWAYLHPNAVHIFERQWLVNWILWGNYRRLQNALLEEIDSHFSGKMVQLAHELTPAPGVMGL